MSLPQVLLPAASLCFLLISPSSAAENDHHIQAEQSTVRSNGGCVEFTNLGTNNPKLLNSCNDARTVQVVNYDKNGALVATRIFHLWHKEERPIAFPGYQMAIEWEKDWTSDGSDDGSRYVSLYHHDVDGADLWEARNSSDRYNAVQFKVYANARLTTISWYVLPPSQSARMYVFVPPDKGYLILDWSRVDPK